MTVADDRRDAAVDAYINGKTSIEVGKMFDVASDTVVRWVRAAGFEVRPPGGCGNRWDRLPKVPRLPYSPTRDKGEGAINLFALSEGDCLRLGGLCSFKSCRYRLPGGGCCLKLAAMGRHDLVETAAALGVSKQAVDQLERKLVQGKRLRVFAKDWR